MDVFTELESEVRSYCRTWPTVFTRASGSQVWDRDGRAYVDFFAGAGALNYGHNHPHLIEPLIEYLRSGGILHSLDMHTEAKERFLERFQQVVLEPRDLPHKVMFPGPTGTNSVEAALKLARKVTGRDQIISFTNAFHGMTLGSLAVTGNGMKRGGAGVPLSNSTTMPYCDYLDEGSSLDYLETLLGDSGSGLDQPAAVIVETTQGEGGLNTASTTWLRRLATICRSHDILLIVDDIQMGCGRTGPFFSFEPSEVVPDVVCLSKSLSGSGLPMALTLLHPDLDVWQPGEHNGTFRGNNAAFVTATAALDLWDGTSIEQDTAVRADQIENSLLSLAGRYASQGADLRGRGMAQGLVFEDPEIAGRIASAAFERGLLVETSGPDGEVLKVMPPVNAAVADLDRGLDILDEAVADAIGRTREEAGR